MNVHQFSRRTAALGIVFASAGGLAACSDSDDHQSTDDTVASSSVKDSSQSARPTKSRSSSAIPEPTEGNSALDANGFTDQPEPTPSSPDVGAQADSPQPDSQQPDLSDQGANQATPPANNSQTRDASYNCRTRVAPPLNSASVPIHGGGSFNYTVRNNRYDPCKQLSWIHIAGDHNGPKEGVLLYHYGEPVNSPHPRLLQSVTDVHDANNGTVEVSYRTANGATGTVTYQATVQGVMEVANSLPANADRGATRLAGATS